MAKLTREELARVIAEQMPGWELIPESVSDDERETKSVRCKTDIGEKRLLVNADGRIVGAQG